MPELPEVETIRRRLAEVVVGKVIAGVSVFRTKSFVGDQAAIVGTTIVAIRRQAKVLEIALSNQLSILVHLKMTGQLIVACGDQRVGGGHPTADWVRDLPSKHTRVEITFQDEDTQLFFNDQRVFGWLKVVDNTQKKTELAQYGPDINDLQLTTDYFWQGLQKTRMPIKVRLMDSHFVAGVGNIYACDALNLAKISPFRAANTLSRDESDRLYMAAKQVIERGIALGGTTFDGKYVGIDGFAGGYQAEVLTYGRKGEPCKNCGTALEKATLGGRGTYYCPTCQV